MLSLLLFTTLLVYCYGNTLPNEGHTQDVVPSEEVDPLENYPIESVQLSIVQLLYLGIRKRTR